MFCVTELCFVLGDKEETNINSSSCCLEPTLRLLIKNGVACTALEFSGKLRRCVISRHHELREEFCSKNIKHGVSEVNSNGRYSLKLSRVTGKQPGVLRSPLNLEFTLFSFGGNKLLFHS
eukprot:snap_masked-scaffold_4-processed-gene-10.29-mRNA-1 protein AED:1.00 eAED:1.00 QI:0/0/0/0/1/1/4/0/119